MTVKEAIETRRAFRFLDTVEITESMIGDLTNAALLSPSCFNNQPWRLIFVKEKSMLEKVHSTLSEGNAWAKKASLIIVVFGKKENDCVIKDREYFLFDTGLATQAIILQATELGLAAHPIAGFSPEKVKEILEIPQENIVITLLIVGKKSANIRENMTQKQIEAEENRPQRRKVSGIMSIDMYNNELGRT